MIKFLYLIWNLKRDVSNTGRNSNVVHLNVTTNNDTATGSPQQHKVEIENLDTLSKVRTRHVCFSIYMGIGYQYT